MRKQAVADQHVDAGQLGEQLAVLNARVLRIGKVYPCFWKFLLHVLRHLRVPPLLVAVIGLMVRYLTVLSDAALRLMRARDARSVGSGGSLLWRVQVTGNMVGQLFLRSYDRSQRVYQALLARGFDGCFLTATSHQMHAHDWWTLAVTVIALALVHMAEMLM